jgi:preprotein translocase SecE subunit
MAAYKPEQGRMARMAVFWVGAALIFYGCKSLRETLAGVSETLAKPLFEDFRRLPVVGVELTPAFLIAAVVFVGALVLGRRLQEQPKNADLLIETESELRKVTWPSAQEVFNSSLVVVVFVVVLMAFLAGADWVLARFTNNVLGLGG